MEKPAFTPKGWIADIKLDREFVMQVDDQYGGAICNVVGPVAFRSPQEQAANTHLISAGPEMYEALVEVRAELWSDWHSHMSLEQFNAEPTIVMIDAALAKARGETAQ